MQPQSTMAEQRERLRTAAAGPTTKTNSTRSDQLSQSSASGDGPLVGTKRKSTDGYAESQSEKKKTSIGFGLKKPGDETMQKKTISVKPSSKNPVVSGIKLTIGAQKPKEFPSIVKPKNTVASVFNADDESDEEEMPPEAKMRMRNVGKFTATAAGPNSFGKGGLGFCDRRKIKERELQNMMEKVSGDNLNK